MAPAHSVKVLEQCRVAPPTGTTTQTTLPLTFFDLLWITTSSVEHLLFYDFPHSKNHFTRSVLPLIKHSLSLTLQQFYPLAGNLIWSQEPNTKPTLRYMDGDSVSLAVIECHNDYDHLVSNHARDGHTFHPLVPRLVASDTMTQVLAVQVTLFPHYGLCIGFTLHHGVADGSTALQFMRSWSSLCKFTDEPEKITVFSPFYDRSVIKDKDGLEGIYLKDLRHFKWHLKTFKASEITTNGVDVVRVTFILSRTHIKRLNQWLVRLVCEKKIPQFYSSTYVLVCAYVMVCLVKARRIDERKKTIQIAFPTGCRTRLNYPIPTAYFGNCIGICCTPALKCDMIKGEDGFLVAAEGIGRAIEDLETGVLKGAEKWVENNLICDMSNERVMVAGTLKLNFYETDFGWGRPRKSEVISMEKKGAFSLGETWDGDGVEVGLALNKHEMEAFCHLFDAGLKSQ